MIKSRSFLLIVSCILLAQTNITEAKTYSITPYDFGVPGGVEILGGTFSTDGTTGNGLALSLILTDWEVRLTDGTNPFTLTPSNSAVVVDSHIFDVTESAITFVDGNEGRVFQLGTPSAPDSSFYGWFEGRTEFALESRVIISAGGLEDGIRPAPSFIGNVAFVPEPTSIALLGFSSLCLFRRR
jgi:hypothetical protein